MMLDKEIKKAYELMYSPVLTPYNLLENAKLSNYEYVNYYKKEERLIAEMKCTMPSGESTVFYYSFDERDYLESIVMENCGELETVFSREKELAKLKSQIKKEQTVTTEIV